MRLPKLFDSSSFRLALLYVALLAGTVLILFGFLYWTTAGYLARQTDATIDADLVGLEEQYRQQGLAGLIRLISERVASNPNAAAL